MTAEAAYQLCDPYLDLEEAQDDFNQPNLFPPMRTKNQLSDDETSEYDADLFPTPPSSVSGKKTLTIEGYLQRRKYRGRSNSGSSRSSSVSSVASDEHRFRKRRRSRRDSGRDGSYDSDSSCSTCRSCSCCSSSSSRSRSRSSRRVRHHTESSYDRDSRSRSGRRTRRHTECSSGHRSASRSPVSSRHRHDSHRSRHGHHRKHSREGSYRSSSESPETLVRNKRQHQRERQNRHNSRIQSDHNYFQSTSNRSRSYSRSRSRSRRRHRSRSRSYESVYSRLPHDYPRERPRDRWRSRSIERENRKRYSEYKKDEKLQKMKDRRIVYVGGIPDDMTRHEMRKLFGGFGEIEEVNIHVREVGDNYGFVTFVYQCDAYAVLESHKKDPYLRKYDLCFGGRREFCKTGYADLDGEQEEREEALWAGGGSHDDFDSLLKQTMNLIKRK